MTFLDRYNEFKRFDKFLDGKTSPIIDTLIDIEGRLTIHLQEFIEKLSYSNGILDPTQNYQRQLLELRNAVIQAYAASPLRRELLNYIDTIPEILMQHGRSISTINNLTTGRLDNELLAEEYAQKLANEYSVEVFTKETIQPLLDNYRRMLSGRTELATMRKSIEEQGGRLGRYAKQIVLDSQRTLIGEANKQILEGYNLNGFIYEGGLVKDSRPLCVHLVGLRRVIGLKEMREWLNEDKYPEFQEGLMPSTNWRNFVQRVAGFGCRHKAQPVRLLPNDIKRINKHWGRELYKIEA